MNYPSLIPIAGSLALAGGFALLGFAEKRRQSALNQFIDHRAGTIR